MVLNQVDVDGSGAVEWDEFCVLMYRKVVIIIISIVIVIIIIMVINIIIIIIITMRTAEDHQEHIVWSVL